MLQTIQALVERLQVRGVRYCHWKSNWALEASLLGENDVDLLVGRSDAAAFRSILNELGFRPAIEADVSPFPSVEHHLALDPTGSLVHVHAYYRAVTGQSLAKNFRFPVEDMLLDHVRLIDGITVPTPQAELIVFVLRMSLKHTSVPELVMLRRDWKGVRAEADWLVSDDVAREAERLLGTWLPGFRPSLFREALAALRDPAPLWRRILVGRRVRAELRCYARHGRIHASATGVFKLGQRIARRLFGSRKGLSPAGGGAVIAFVGPEAAGKSTLLEGIASWLGGRYSVARVHAGKPPGTVLTAVPNLVLPALRALLSSSRSTRVALEHPADAGGVPVPLVFAIRSVLLAYDRRAALRRAFARSVNGVIVLCDRYPSCEVGALDGAQLSGRVTGGAVRGRLARLEAALYRDIPPPDLVIRVTAPLELTLQRNRTRSKVEGDEYVQRRYEASARMDFGRADAIRIDATRPLETCLDEVKDAIWSFL